MADVYAKKRLLLLGAINKGAENIGITIASLNNPNLIVPGKQHSYKESTPSWWKVSIIKKWW